MRWTLCCRVVDNFGDLGVAWRLAADLAARGENVRLAVDDASALQWMAPAGATGVEVVAWDAAVSGPVDVVVELFGAGLPRSAVDASAVRINVEHLSGESYVERSHGLPRGAGAACTWYYFPGFVRATGGLLREPSLLAARRGFGDGTEWLRSRGLDVQAGERRVSLFCYDNDALAEAVEALAVEPTLLLAAPGDAARQVRDLLGPRLRRGDLRAIELAYLTQTDFDRLLWSCDLNFVRGEDSVVRAIWAGAPFVWQLYRQDDGAHRAKLDAFLGRLLGATDPPLAAIVRAAFERWNGVRIDAPVALAPLGAWAKVVEAWRDTLAMQADLTSQLIGFAASKR